MECGFGFGMLPSGEHDRPRPIIERYAKDKFSEYIVGVPPEVDLAWGSTGGLDTPFPWKISKEKTLEGVRNLSFPPPQGFLQIFVKGNIVIFSLEPPLLLWEKPLYSR
jgi:hypothetical protein